MAVGDSIRVFAPATVANVACGFDVLGFAIDAPGDELDCIITAEPGVRIAAITGDNGKLPLDPQKNSAAVAIQRLLDHIDAQYGCEIVIHKKMPSGSGLGSSAASAVAGLFAAHQLLAPELPKQEVLPFLLEAEEAACGSAIADNVAASLFGGFILVRSYEPLEVIQLPVPGKALRHRHLPTSRSADQGRAQHSSNGDPSEGFIATERQSGRIDHWAPHQRLWPDFQVID